MVEPFKAPFNFDSVLLSMPNVFASVGDYADFKAEGPVNLAKLTADLKIDLLRFDFQGVVLDRPHFPFSVHYDENCGRRQCVCSLACQPNRYSFK